MIETILADLRAIFGEKVLLEPADLVNVLGISTGQQANLRSEGKFPIEIVKMGGKVKVSIYALAKFLAGQSKPAIKEQLAQAPRLDRKAKKKAKGHLEKDWWLGFRERIFACIHRVELSNHFKESAFSKTIQI